MKYLQIRFYTVYIQKSFLNNAGSRNVRMAYSGKSITLQSLIGNGLPKAGWWEPSALATDTKGCIIIENLKTIIKLNGSFSSFFYNPVNNVSDKILLLNKTLLLV